MAALETGYSLTQFKFINFRTQSSKNDITEVQETMFTSIFQTIV